MLMQPLTPCVLKPAGTGVHSSHCQLLLVCTVADAYQTPKHEGAQWSCSKDADRWYTITFCPRGTILVDDRDESKGLGTKSQAPSSAPALGNKAPNSAKATTVEKAPRKAGPPAQKKP